MSYGKTLELFLVDGNPDGIISAHLSNWNGEAIKIPRIAVSDYTREDLDKPGIYFLFCKGDDKTQKESVYIGESEDVYKRLTEHLRDYENDREEFYWISAVVFTGSELDKTSIRYLEDKAANATRDAERFTLLTKKTYNTKISEPKQAAMNEFFDNMKTLLNTLGFKVLEPLLESQIKNETPKQSVIFSLVSNTIKARMIQTAEGCVVLKGSEIRQNEASMTPAYKQIRDTLLSSNTIKDFIFQEDYLFNSPSAASCVLLGNSTSGNQYWKTEDGTKLGELSQTKKKSM